ncbi:MAG: hypothetical protein ACREAW_00400, partial [Nitrososphaera sp.]
MAANQDPVSYVTDVNGMMLKSIAAVKSKLNSTVSNAAAIAILDENPCIVKCVTDLQNATHSNDIDPLYIARHDYAKIKLVDRIAQKFCSRFEVGSEHETRTGKLDVAIVNHKIILTSGRNVVGIEVKSGKSMDIFQLTRYLLECGKLVFVRVPT